MTCSFMCTSVTAGTQLSHRHEKYLHNMAAALSLECVCVRVYVVCVCGVHMSAGATQPLTNSWHCDHLLSVLQPVQSLCLPSLIQSCACVREEKQVEELTTPPNETPQELNWCELSLECMWFELARSRAPTHCKRQLEMGNARARAYVHCSYGKGLPVV